MLAAVHVVGLGCHHIKHTVAAAGGIVLRGAQSARIVPQRIAAFRRIAVAAPDGGAAGALARGIAAFHGKARLDPEQHGFVIVTGLAQAHEIFHRHGGILWIQHGAHFAKAGVKNGNRVTVLGRSKLHLLAFHRGALDAAARSAFFAAARQSQNGGKAANHTQRSFRHENLLIKPAYGSTAYHEKTCRSKKYNAF